MMKIKTQTAARLALLALCGVVTTSLIAEDWPQWGGNDPGRNMYSKAKGLPDKFDAGKLKTGTEEVDMATTKNVKWAIKLGSQSYGNPVVTGVRPESDKQQKWQPIQGQNPATRC